MSRFTVIDGGAPDTAEPKPFDADAELKARAEAAANGRPDTPEELRAKFETALRYLCLRFAWFDENTRETLPSLRETLATLGALVDRFEALDHEGGE